MGDRTRQRLSAKRGARPRVLFVGEHLTASHMMRPLMLAEHLAETRPDLEVHFAGPPLPKVAPDLPRALTLHILPSPDNHVLSRRVERVFFPLYREGEVNSMVEAETALLTALQPRLVIHDFRNTLALSSQVAGIPLIALADFYWSRSYKPALVVPDNPLINIIGYSLTEKITGFLTPRVQSIHIAPFNHCASTLGLPPFENLSHLYSTGIENWFYDFPSMLPFPSRPEDQCIGPVLWERGGDPPEWLTQLPEHEAVCITFSTNGDPRLLPRIIRALKPLGRPLIVLTAGRALLSDEPGVYVADFLPISEVLRRSAVLVCPGGSTLTYSAIKAGIPVLGIPSNITHWYAMRRFSEEGLGILLSPHNISDEKLRLCVGELVHGKTYTDACTRASAELSLYEPKKLVNEHVTRLLKQ